MKLKDRLLLKIRNGEELPRSAQFRLIALLGLPAILAQFSTIVMQYIDAAMVGRLGADPAAAVGIVTTTTWLFGGLCFSAATGFSVQVAHQIGGGDFRAARDVLRTGFKCVLLLSAVLLLVGCAISGTLPRWLRGDASIHADAASYFFIFSLGVPFIQLNFLAGNALRAAGNVAVPTLLNILMCIWDVLLNWLLIFPSRDLIFFGLQIHVPGADLGVTGAALGTAIAEVITALSMTYYLCFRCPDLHIFKRKERPVLTASRILKRAFRVSLPMALERAVMCSAQILSTVIVAPLGNVAIAANSFAITAESLCYLPGYGVGDAAITLVGQSVGAGRKELTYSFARLTTWTGIAVMTLMGVVLYAAAPLMMALFTPDMEVQTLGVSILRIEAFAEPMFAAAIVVYGVFVGLGRTIVPAAMNLFSIWAVRLTLAALLVDSYGLRGVWIAMCVELCFRGLIFLGWMRLRVKKV